MTKKKLLTERFGWLKRLIDWATNFYAYCTQGVWSDTRGGLKVNVIKTLNLSVVSFMNKDLQTQACNMAFRTLLATVPALALLFALCRGFGFSNLMKTSLMSYFPAQREALEKGLTFVDSYLEQTSEGLFVGVGLIFLLWTLISLVSSAEMALNSIWGVPDRSWMRKVIDYTAIFLILPVLMICSTGINIFMSSTIQTVLPFKFISPLISALLDSAGLFITWIFFTGVYMLLPNTKVKFKNAFLAGALSGTAFTILQWLFVSGQIYVSKYNAIYGSFAFLPLVMLWLQLVWVITLAGAVVCFSAQNIFQYSFSTQISKISFDYRRKILLAVLTIICHKYRDRATPPDAHSIAVEYSFPMSLVSELIMELERAKLVNKVVVAVRNQEFGFMPGVDLQQLTVGYVIRELRMSGVSDFIPGFSTRFKPLISIVNEINEKSYGIGDGVKIVDLQIEPGEINPDKEKID